MRRIISVFAVAALLASMTIMIRAPVALGQEEPPEELLCVAVLHTPPGNPENAHVIVVEPDSAHVTKHMDPVIGPAAYPVEEEEPPPVEV